MERLDGYCPMGCGATLFVDAGGFVTCSYVHCPRPDAVAELLRDWETEHVAELREDEFTLRHPLRERLDDGLFACKLHARIAALDGPPRTPGRYRVVVDAAGRWHWTLLPTTAVAAAP